MNSPSAVVCREIFDENSQPSAEEISDYAQQLGIDPESETHLLPLAKDGLMQALPSPWKAYFDEKLETHYYYNEETKKTQWEHPLDHVYRDLVKKARDASMHDDTCASVQELLTSEENTKHLEKIETKAESDDEELTTDSEHQSDIKDNVTNILMAGKRLTPLGRPPLAPISRIDKKLCDLRISPLRRSVDSSISNKPSFRPELNRPSFERPKLLFKQQSEIIDLKMNVLNSPEEENFSSLLSMAKVETGLSLTGKGGMFFKLCKSDLPSPETDKSLPLDSLTKSDPPKGILREKLSHSLQRKSESIFFERPKQSASFEEDKKIVRFKLENLPDPTVSPGSNSSSEQNDGQSSIISATPAPTVPSPVIPSSPVIQSPLSSPPVPLVPLNPPLVLSPLVTRPPLPPRPLTSLDKDRSIGSDKELKESLEIEGREVKSASPGRRLLRPPAAEYIKPDLFQKNFQKISDLVRPCDIETSVNLEEPVFDKEVRPRSPMIPQKNKISINLMESIESETSLDSPDADFANLDFNDLDISIENDKDVLLRYSTDTLSKHNRMEEDEEQSINKSMSSNSVNVLSPLAKENILISQIKVPKLDMLSKQSTALNSDSDDSKKTSLKDKLSSSSKTEGIEIKDKIQLKSPTPSYCLDIHSPRSDSARQRSNLTSFKPSNKPASTVTALKSSESSTSLSKVIPSPRLDGVILSQGKSSSDNVVVVYQFESQEDNYPKLIKSPLIIDTGRDMIERNKGDERRRLELALQKELENIRMEWTSKERKMKADLLAELRETEEKFSRDMKTRLTEQADRHKKEIEEALSKVEQDHQLSLRNAIIDFEDRYKREIESLEKQHQGKLVAMRDEYQKKLSEQQRQLEIENDRALSDLRELLETQLQSERTRMIEQNKTTVQSLREEHANRVGDLRNDYRAEVESLRRQHACHLEDVRRRLAHERANAGHGVVHGVDRALHEKYRALKEKYARLKHDVKMSIERRNKRREMSMTTGSETEKSNSHKATQSLERCKEVNESSVSAIIEQEPSRQRVNNNHTVRYNDNETSHSESNVHNNNDEWRVRKEKIIQSEDTSETSGAKTQKPHRRTTVAFREPPRRKRDRDRDAATTDFQDSSDCTTADEKPKESLNAFNRI